MLNIKVIIASSKSSVITLHLLGWSLKKKEKITSADKDAEKLKLLCITGGNVKWCSHCGKNLAITHKAKHRITI